MESNLKYALLHDPDMKEVFDSFVVETKEILENLDVDLVVLEKNSEDKELLNKVFRSFHTVKGTAGFLGLDKLTELTHKGEDILNKLRKGEVKLNSIIMDSILLAYDKMGELLFCIETNKNEDVDLQDSIDILSETIKRIEKNDFDESFENIEMSSVETTEVAEEKFFANINSEENKEEENYLDEETPEELLIKDEKKVSEKETSVDTQKQNKTKSADKSVDNSIRVDVQRLDDLLNIVSELVLGRNRLAQVNTEINSLYEGAQVTKNLSEATKQIDLMTTELQLVVMKTRMIKIGKVFNKFPRLVRDLSKENGKDIELIITGEETELDKTLIEEINDPLVHLVRNSFDHGIEDPDTRIKKNKSPKGKIHLSASHEGNNILISIEDDGKGIDPEFIKEKAISKGLLSRDKAKEMTRQEALNLIFLPGFSTAEKVTNVSGRGVGMDVVKTNVTRLRGTILIDSVVGAGTKITIRLPLTLAIIPGMIVRVKNTQLIIPLNSVFEAVRRSINEISTINGSEVIRMRDEIVPLVTVDHLFRDDSEFKKNTIWQYIVVVGIGEKKFGIKVDGLIGQKEVVIKPLGNYLGTVPGVAGSTIMGDGTVVMILDIGELVNKVTEEVA